MITLTLAENEQQIKDAINTAIPQAIQLDLIDKYKTGLGEILTECANLYRDPNSNPNHASYTATESYAIESANSYLNYNPITNLYQLYNVISKADAQYNLPLACEDVLETAAKQLHSKLEPYLSLNRDSLKTTTSEVILGKLMEDTNAAFDLSNTEL